MIEQVADVQAYLRLRWMLLHIRNVCSLQKYNHLLNEAVKEADLYLHSVYSPVTATTAIFVTSSAKSENVAISTPMLMATFSLFADDEYSI